MLTEVPFLFLSLLPAHAAGQLVSAAAKCSPGFEWLFTSINQSPCDVAVELGGVCVASEFNVTQLDPGNVYLGPTVSNANSCRCSSVYYSLLCACAFCQQHSYIRWSAYNPNCSTAYVANFPQPAPLGVKVPTWAYQNVSTSDIFDINIANSTKGEGPPSSTASSSSGVTSSYPATSTSRDGSSSKIGAIAGAVGGLVGLALIGGILAFCLIWRRRRSPKAATTDEPFLINPNRRPEVTRPTIPGFSAPSTPFVPSGLLEPTSFYHVPNTANTSPPTGYPPSLGGTSEIYERNPVPLPNIGERYPNPQRSSAKPVIADGYYDPQASFSAVPVTTDSYWTQTSASSIAHSQPSTDRYYDSPVALSVAGTHQTGETRYNDQRSVTTHRQSSVISSPQPYLTGPIRLLPPSYADAVDEMPRPLPLPEKLSS